MGVREGLKIGFLLLLPLRFDLLQHIFGALKFRPIRDGRRQVYVSRHAALAEATTSSTSPIARQRRSWKGAAG
jgi:hypothetical protein